MSRDPSHAIAQGPALRARLEKAEGELSGMRESATPRIPANVERLVPRIVDEIARPDLSVEL